MNRMIIVNQKNVDDIQMMNKLQIDDMYTILYQNEEYSIICQYSKKYDNFHIVSVKTDRLNDKLNITTSA